MATNDLTEKRRIGLQTIVAQVLFNDYDTEYAGGVMEDFLPLAERVLAAVDDAGYDLVKRPEPPSLMSFHPFESSRRSGLCTICGVASDRAIHDLTTAQQHGEGW